MDIFKLNKTTKTISVYHRPKTVTIKKAGLPGVGIPAGGTDGQILTKDGSGDYQTSWKPAPGVKVNTVFGRDGDVEAEAGDYAAGQITVTPAGGITATNVQDALEDLDSSTAGDISDEVAARIAGDQALQSNLDDEEAARTAADSTLQSNINSEQTARQNADTTLQTNINNEASARATADTTLQTNITNETNARIAADGVLDAAIDDETSARQAADSTLQSNINAEATARGNADTVLQDNIDDEEAARIAADDLKQDLSEKGVANGYAELDGTGKVPSSQLPAYVDDVLEFANLAAFPATGTAGIIYIAQDTNKTYRWSGSAYVEISASLALGETSSTAYRGDRGKIAYDHSQLTSGNPHNVTKSDVGLGNVDNTSDATKNAASATLTNKVLDAGTVVFADTTDPTKRIQMVLSGISTGQTRQITFPNTGITVVGTTATQNLTNKTLDNTNTITLKDANFTIQDDGDATKQVRFEATAITAGQTRTINIPDATGTMLLRSDSATVQNKTLDNSNVATFRDDRLTIQDDGDATRQARFNASSISTGTTRTISLPNVSDTLVARSSTDTLTNKTIDGGSNTLTNISADSTVDGTTNHVFTAADDTKLAGIEAGADVTDAANVEAAGAVMTTGDQTMSGSLEVEGALLSVGGTGTAFNQIKRGTSSNYAGFQWLTNNVLKWTLGTRPGSEDIVLFDENAGAALVTVSPTTGNMAVAGAVDGRDLAADGTKLDGIESGADVTDATNVDAAGAVMNTDTSTAAMSFVVDEDDMVSNSATKVPTQQSVKAYVDANVGGGAVDSVNGQTGVVVLDQDDIADGTTYKQYSQSEKTKLAGIETAADVTDAGNVGSSINGATAKTTPVDADTMPLIDSAASNVLKKVTWANIKATLKTYYDTLYQAASSNLTAFAAKTAPSGAVVGDTDTQTLTNKTFTDNVTTFQDETDNSKKMQFQLNAISPSTTRTITVPNFNGTMYVSGGTDVSVADGGTGRSTSTTAYGLIAAGTTATGALQTISPGTSGQILKSNGASALATFQTGAAADVGLGNVTNDAQIKSADFPSSSVDSEIALFSSTTGKVLKRASVTGMLKAASGVLSAATAETDYTTPTGTGTMTNKRITPRVGTTTSSATPTINTDNVDAYSITALAANITSFTTNLSGTPTDFQKLVIRIKDNGSARTIAWGSSFEAKGRALPTTTAASKVLTVMFLWDSVTSKWGCIAAAQEV